MGLLQTEGLNRTSGRMGAQGPSLSAVLALNVSQPPSEIGVPRPQPPLQRIRAPMVGVPHPNTEADCTRSHLEQLKDKYKREKREARGDRREYRREMRTLNASFESEFEEQAARRAWGKDVAAHHLEAKQDKTKREIMEHRIDYAEPDFFPFKSERPIEMDAETYGAVLRRQADEDRRRDALRIMQEGRTTSSAVPMLAASLPEEKAIADPAVAASARASVQAESTRRAVELRLRMVQHQQQKERYAAKMMKDLERKEAEDRARAALNQQQMRQVLSLQAADKMGRDLREHVKIFGEHGGLLPPEEGGRRAKALDRRHELEREIAQKQRERKALKRAQTRDARHENKAAAKEKALGEAHEEAGKAQTHAELRLAWARQEAELRARRRAEMQRSTTERLVSENLAKLTADDRFKFTL